MQPTRYISAICIVFLVLQLGFVFVMAASVGVKPGQWAKYKVLGQPSYMSMKISISSVSGTTAYVNMAYEYPGGSTEFMSFQGDVLDGGMFPYIVPANLDEGDYIYCNIGSGNLEVQNVTTRSYAGASRTIICVTDYSGAYYWDQQTGILVEETSSSGSTVISLYKLTETNIWGGGIFDTSNPLFWVLVVVIVVVVAAVALVVLSSLRKKKPITETVTTPSQPVEKSAKTKYCLKCGTSMPSDSIYCPKCGHKQSQT